MFSPHLSRRARQKYEIGESPFAEDPAAPGAALGVARRIAERIFEVSGQVVPASEIHAMELIDEILRQLVRGYEKQNPGTMARALDFLESNLGPRLDGALLTFIGEFPPEALYQGRVSEAEYFAENDSARATSIEGMLLLDLANSNPAFEPYKELIDDSGLRATAYTDAVGLLADFLSRQPAFEADEAGSGAETLPEILAEPAEVSPRSLGGQLEFLLEKWGALLDESLRLRLLRAIDFVKEENVRRAPPGGALTSAPVLEFGDQPEYERFSPDREWMPRLVLIAKNSYVWLDQLARWYARDIHRLDQVPDEELDTLAGRGFTGLWLIGLWERSRASQHIKQMMGDPEAVASAYSLHSYDIAADLGGWQALEDLRRRAWQRGIRLSADMVPNHMGIDSAWVMEHPDWFLSVPFPPYPTYSFNGPDLSQDGRAAVFLEDHYYAKSDAAVVFKRLGRAGGEASFIYHGNDGTSFPWNDTAQLDYLNPQVREAVIQTILHVARNFPIIRFDAAMTLAKKHIQRLWYPEPGAGGAIPSRAEHGLSRAEFEARLPTEFWREVVDRVAAEAPDTLLLAEAFWLMEGYFVRTLGMHRVYNSAFMHMLRDEHNAKYRQVIKNTLEFDPQILKRYVNFMNNPDENSAAEQFGNGDKYFGVATLLATLPGLPMFGHGQVEGFREKYGMEFRRARWEEHPDGDLVRHHEDRIFPLLHRRAIFAEAEHFRLYDLFTREGTVNEDVFAYSNRTSAGSGLVIYHNKFGDTRGWIKTSAAAMDKGSGRLAQASLADGLGLPPEGFVIFRDYVSGLEYIRPAGELAEKGLYVELGAYQCHVFMDFRFESDPEGKWKSLSDALGGGGAASLDAKWRELFAPQETPEASQNAVGRVQRAKSKTQAVKRKTQGAKAKTQKAGAKKPAAKKASRAKGPEKPALPGRPASKPAQGSRKKPPSAKPKVK
jgi:glycosidase